MRTLGVDPGSHRTGWGVVSGEGNRLVHLDSGTITAGAGELPARLGMIADELDRVLREYAPDAVAIETIFHARNAQSALLLGHARGVALLCAARAGVPVFEYTAGQIKQATTGRGRADKEQVQQMIRIILGCRQPMGLDTSDALAAAICHAQMQSSAAVRLMADAARGRGKATRGGHT